VWETTCTAREAHTTSILDGFPQNTVRNANQPTSTHCEPRSTRKPRKGSFNYGNPLWFHELLDTYDKALVVMEMER
jgi:hypothetical protein